MYGVFKTYMHKLLSIKTDWQVSCFKQQLLREDLCWLSSTAARAGYNATLGCD